MPLTHAVVIITYRRPDHLRECLDSIAQQSTMPQQVVVVDQSPDDESSSVVRDFSFAVWVDNRVNAGHMTTSRNIGLLHVDADVVSFIDDDSLPAPDWAEALLAHFARADEIGGIGGRVDNNQPGEAEASGPIGIITRSGRVIGNFGADRALGVSITHAVGANMSFRREALVILGGFREDYPGTAMGEDTDMSLRVQRLGLEIRYAPDALVRHVSAPHVIGARFDGRYAFYASANYVLLCRRNFGALSSEFVGRLVAAREEVLTNRSVKGRAYRIGCAVTGAIYGLWLCLRLDGLRRPPLLLSTERAQAIRRARSG